MGFFSYAKNFLDRIQSSSEQARRWWAFGLMACAITAVVLSWAVYFDATVKSFVSEQEGQETGDPLVHQIGEKVAGARGMLQGLLNNAAGLFEAETSYRVK